MKTIINVFGTTEIGKTSAIKAAYAKMKGINPIEMPEGDICETIQTANGKLIGFASAGDPYSSQKSDIQTLIDKGCEIIVCASRTKGYTIYDVETFAKNYGYTLISISPLTFKKEKLDDTTSKKMICILTDINAMSIVNLINEFITNNL